MTPKRKGRRVSALDKFNQKEKMKIQAYGYTFTVEFHADEKEYCATWNGFSAYGRTQERAIAVCHAMMIDTLLCDCESEF